MDSTGEGEVCMNGRNIMMGYLKNEEATMEIFDSERFIRSGDLGRLYDRGFLRITGRIKELIITAGGENIAPVPIEHAFKALCAACSNIIVVGENERFIAALITFKVDIDQATGLPTSNLTPEATTYFKTNCDGIHLTNSEDACTNTKVLAHIDSLIDETNKIAISRAAQIRKFKLIPTDFTPAGGEMTPTTKLRRNATC